MLVQPVDRIRCYFSYFRLHKQHGATGRVATVLNFSYIRDTYEKFFEGGAGGLAASFLCVMVWVFIVFSIFCIKSFGVCARPNDPCRDHCTFLGNYPPTLPLS